MREIKVEGAKCGIHGSKKTPMGKANKQQSVRHVRPLQSKFNYNLGFVAKLITSP